MLESRTFDPRLLDRRTFLAELGRGAFAIAIVSIASCAPNLATSPAPSGPGGTPAGATPPAGSAPVTVGGHDWERVNLGFVSAYLLVRDGEAALVDTGVKGSEGTIESSLRELGLGWDAVAHVILTHRHGDHVGSIDAVLAAAPDAIPYIGANESVSGISVSHPMMTLGDGDTVFDLRIVNSPGHTAGSISVLDPIAGVLVAGDAMGISGGKPTLPGAQFTEDMEEAKRSIVSLSGLTFETLLVGHGDPIEAGASALVAELAAAG